MTLDCFNFVPKPMPIGLMVYICSQFNKKK
jgi:hypothetical protein